CPPENWCGYFNILSGLSPTSSNNSCTRFLSSDFDNRSKLRSGSAIISSTLFLPFNEEYGSWNIICTSLCNPDFLLPKLVISSPSKNTFPVVILLSPTIALPVVVFPDPDSPTNP